MDGHSIRGACADLDVPRKFGMPYGQSIHRGRCGQLVIVESGCWTLKKANSQVRKGLETHVVNDGQICTTRSMGDQRIEMDMRSVKRGVT